MRLLRFSLFAVLVLVISVMALFQSSRHAHLDAVTQSENEGPARDLNGFTLIVPEHHAIGMEVLSNLRDHSGPFETHTQGENSPHGSAFGYAPLYHTVLRAGIDDSSDVRVLERYAKWVPTACYAGLFCVLFLICAIIRTPVSAVIVCAVVFSQFPFSAQFAPGLLVPTDLALVFVGLAFASIPSLVGTRGGSAWLAVMFAFLATALDRSFGAIAFIGAFSVLFARHYPRFSRGKIIRALALGSMILVAGLLVWYAYIEARVNFSTHSRLHSLPGGAAFRGQAGLSRIASSPWKLLAIIGTSLLPFVSIFVLPAINRLAALPQLLAPLVCVGLGFFHPLFFAVIPLTSIPLILAMQERANGRAIALGVVPLIVLGVAPALSHALALDYRAVSTAEFDAITERDLAHYLAKRFSPAETVVLAPPETGTGLRYFGGFKVLASANVSNESGLQSTVAIVSSTTVPEAEALLSERAVRLIVVPSWNKDLQTFAQLNMVKPEDAFISAIDRWAVPPFLRPISYALPALDERRAPHALILEVLEVGDAADSAADFAEYFLDTRRVDLAQGSLTVLKKYPTHTGCAVALARVQRELGNATEFNAVYEALSNRFKGRYPPNLAWRHRITFAQLAGLTRDVELSRAQTMACLKECSLEKLKSLNPEKLFRFLNLIRFHKLTFSEPALGIAAIALLPYELQSKLSELQAPTK